MNDDFVAQVMAQARIAAHLNGIPFTSADFARIESVLDFEAVTALERAEDGAAMDHAVDMAESRASRYDY